MEEISESGGKMLGPLVCIVVLLVSEYDGKLQIMFS